MDEPWEIYHGELLEGRQSAWEEEQFTSF